MRISDWSSDVCSSDLDRVMAELRGHQSADGTSPVWEALGRPFYRMDFDEADRFGGRYGNQFIAELGPHFPLYADLLPPAARAALGRPRAQSRPAYDMLLAEGFRDRSEGRRVGKEGVRTWRSSGAPTH